ncbi:MAG: hypothetical protein ACLSAF_17105 [Intestinimonas sp.]
MRGSASRGGRLYLRHCARKLCEEGHGGCGQQQKQQEQARDTTTEAHFINLITTQHHTEFLRENATGI